MPHPIRYARLGYVSLGVTDLDASIDFYGRLVGLLLERRLDGSAWLRCSDKPYDVILEASSEAGLARVGFEVEDRTALDQAYAHLEARGYEPEWTAGADCATQLVEAGFRFRNAVTGLEVDLYCGQSLASTAYEPTVAHIARLGHVVFNVGDYAAAHQFWVDDLGFEISDHVPGRIAFLRCWPNPLHHSLALMTGPSDGLNHVNFMVTDIDDIGRATNRMKKADVPIVFGPGRHLPSTSIFLYFLDPDGMTAEYSFGMEEIAAEGGRQPRELEPKLEVLDTWGGAPDPRFGKAGAILHG